jgi:hypothetical protein
MWLKRLWQWILSLFKPKPVAGDPPSPLQEFKIWPT